MRSSLEFGSALDFLVTTVDFLEIEQGLQRGILVAKNVALDEVGHSLCGLVRDVLGSRSSEDCSGEFVESQSRGRRRCSMRRSKKVVVP